MNDENRDMSLEFAGTRGIGWREANQVMGRYLQTTWTERGVGLVWA